jgi:hypothetical protein
MILGGVQENIRKSFCVFFEVKDHRNVNLIATEHRKNPREIA